MRYISSAFLIAFVFACTLQAMEDKTFKKESVSKRVIVLCTNTNLVKAIEFPESKFSRPLNINCYLNITAWERLGRPEVAPEGTPLENLFWKCIETELTKPFSKEKECVAGLDWTLVVPPADYSSNLEIETSTRRNFMWSGKFAIPTLEPDFIRTESLYCCSHPKASYCVILCDPSHDKQQVCKSKERLSEIFDVCKAHFTGSNQREKKFIFVCLYRPKRESKASSGKHRKLIR